MTHEIEIEDGEDYHAITVRKVRTLSESGRFVTDSRRFVTAPMLSDEPAGVHPPHQTTFQRRVRFDPDSAIGQILVGDQLLADYIATIPEGTPTLKETARRFRRATREAGK